jgi:hypothetical protein
MLLKSKVIILTCGSTCIGLEHTKVDATEGTDRARPAMANSPHKPPPI